MALLEAHDQGAVGSAGEALRVVFVHGEGTAARAHEGPELGPGESRQASPLVVVELRLEARAAVGHGDRATTALDHPQVRKPAEPRRRARRTRPPR